MNPARFLLRIACVATLGALVLTPTASRATGAVVAPKTAADPSTVDVAIAVAVTPYGTTRWTRLTVGGVQNVMWLVPARPGAALDWASDSWLTSLEEATTPRVAAPSVFPPCGMPIKADKVAAWGATGAKRFPRAVVVHRTASDARAHVAARGFGMSSDVAAKLDAVYANGSSLVSLELDGGGGAIVSTPTLRISDDGGAVVPLALTGSTQSIVRVTATVLGEGPATLAGASDLTSSSLRWNIKSSDYEETRSATLLAGGGAAWVREAAAHDVMFAGATVPQGTAIEPLVSEYFKSASGQASPQCDAAAKNAASAAGVVGRACAQGALARVAGGVNCTPESGAIDPSAFSCGPGVDDLALALAGISPANAFVSRFTGVVSKDGFGMDVAISSGAPQSPVVTAGSYAPCPVLAPGGKGSSGFSPPSPPTSTPPASGDGSENDVRYLTRSGCSGSSTTVVYDDTSTGGQTSDDDDDDDDSTSWDDSDTSSGSSGESCGGGSSSSSSSSSGSDDSSWDDDDDSSSSLSESCDCGGTSSSSSGGWDDSDSEATSQSLTVGGADAGDGTKSVVKKTKAKKKTHGKHKNGHKKTSAGGKRGGPSPVSRYALLFVALLLPLRRRLRMKKL